MDDHRIESVRVRRAPKYSVFLMLGAALGLLVALILTFAFNGTDQPSAAGVTYSDSQVFGFLALVCVTIGIVIGGVIALIFDRAFAKKARTAQVDHERHEDAAA